MNVPDHLITNGPRLRSLADRIGGCKIAPGALTNVIAPVATTGFFEPNRQQPCQVRPTAPARLIDPQACGNLFVSCEVSTAADLWAPFERHGFRATADIGEIVQGDAQRLRIR